MGRDRALSFRREGETFAACRAISDTVGEERFHGPVVDGPVVDGGTFEAFVVDALAVHLPASEVSGLFEPGLVKEH